MPKVLDARQQTDRDTDRGTHFGRGLKAYRQRANLKQRELAEHLIVDRPTLAKIETGNRMPPSLREFWDGLRWAPQMTEEQFTQLVALYDTDIVDRRRALTDDAQGQVIKRLVRGDDGSVVELVVHPGLYERAGDPNMLADLVKGLVETSLRALSSPTTAQPPTQEVSDRARSDDIEIEHVQASKRIRRTQGRVQPLRAAVKPSHKADASARRDLAPHGVARAIVPHGQSTPKRRLAAHSNNGASVVNRRQQDC